MNFNPFFFFTIFFLFMKIVWEMIMLSFKLIGMLLMALANIIEARREAKKNENR